MKYTISKSRLKEVFLLILLYHIAFIRFSYFENYNIIRYMCIALIAIYIILKLNKLIQTLDKRFFKLFLIYSMLIIYSSIKNFSMHTITNTIINGLMYILMFFEFFTIFSLFKQNQNKRIIYMTFYYLSLIYVIITDIMIIINPNLFMKKGNYYFVGNKFSVVYIHFNLIMFYMLMKKINKYDGKLIAIIILTMIISIKIECMTGIIALLALIFIKLLPIKILENGNFAILLLIASGIFSFKYESILQNEYVQFFIVEVLNRNLNLTGRTVIFKYIPVIIKNKLLLGYGHGTSYEVFIKSINYPNSQNGLIDMIVEDGIIATILFICMIKHIFSRNKNNIEAIIIKTIICTFFVISSFEIVLGSMMIAWLALLYNKEKEGTNI